MLISFVPKIRDFQFSKYVHRELVPVPVTARTLLRDLLRLAAEKLASSEARRSAYYGSPLRHWNIIGVWAVDEIGTAVGYRVSGVFPEDAVAFGSIVSDEVYIELEPGP